MKWIQIKNPKWIGRSAEEKCVKADRRRGSELDDGGDVDDGWAGNVERVSLKGLR